MDARRAVKFPEDRDDWIGIYATDAKE